MDKPLRRNRLIRLIQLATLLGGLLLVKVFVGILLEYRWYFPANFDAAFLSGRRETFLGSYRYAFYVHIIASPMAILLGTWLMLSGGKSRWRRLHRVAGRVQFLLIVLAVVPSGLMMAPHSFAGPIATAGFLGLSAAAAVTAIGMVWCARSKRFDAHRRWGTRCYILLLSPLLLRLAGGVFIVSDIESEVTYRLNAWLSWLVPLAIYECLSFKDAKQRPSVTASVTARTNVSSSVMERVLQ